MYFSKLKGKHEGLNTFQPVRDIELLAAMIDAFMVTVEQLRCIWEVSVPPTVLHWKTKLSVTLQLLFTVPQIETDAERLLEQSPVAGCTNLLPLQPGATLSSSAGSSTRSSPDRF